MGCAVGLGQEEVAPSAWDRKRLAVRRAGTQAVAAVADIHRFLCGLDWSGEGIGGGGSGRTRRT